MNRVIVQKEALDVADQLTDLHTGNPSVGAVVTFVGLMRDMNDGDRVTAMELEHYPGMTDKALWRIVEEAERRWELLDIRVIHRVGELRPTDPIVLVAVASAHRGEAFRACEFIIDYLKTRAPFWKKEKLPVGARWVASRDSDSDAEARWHDGSDDEA